MDGLEQYLRLAARLVAVVTETVGMVVVAIAVAQAVVAYLLSLARWSRAMPDEAIRLRLGRSLTLALEMLVAADIVRTAIAPSWEELGQLATIVAIRTVLNFFLQREIAQERRLSGQGASSGSGPPGGE